MTEVEGMKGDWRERQQEELRELDHKYVQAIREIQERHRQELEPLFRNLANIRSMYPIIIPAHLVELQMLELVKQPQRPTPREAQPSGEQ